MVFLIVFILFMILYLLMITPNLTRKAGVADFFEKPFAHRGYHDAKNLIPENSIAAFKQALSHSYGIELDVHLTKDNRLVVFHDDSLTRMCKADRIIEQTSYGELQSYYLAHTSEKIPLFEQVLSLVDGRVPLLIELKIPGKDTRICRYVYEQLRHYNGGYMVQSFNSLGVLWFRQNAPQVLRGQLSSNLTATDKGTPYIPRFLVKYLLLNFLTKPDFISYKFKDRKNPSLWLNRFLFRVPAAAWTLRTKEDFDAAARQFDMLIFERFR